ncbi:MAG: 4-hydroxy-3-methylbut-2-enyl diphosphate reductase [Dehalococcoidales bacterium]|nr:4-hydroxy-3-methylbut-2-enyl diphosphate reductase [Dehalococcoidales bacterium]
MKRKVEKSARTGFCFGVKRAIDILEKVALERGKVEPLGAVVHNRQVMQRLTGLGVKVAETIDDIEGNTVAIGAHGLSPEMETEIRERFTDVINTTCPFVQRAQIAARRLAKAGFYLIVYGEGNHREVKGILGWSGGQGMATLDMEPVQQLDTIPRRIGVLSQTTQIPSSFNQFVKDLIDHTLTKDTELRIIDTICHDIRERQKTAIELATRVDLMFVIGSNTSANSNHLAELCSTVTETYMVETADEILPSMLEGHSHIGVTGGASTAEETISQVIEKLESADV